MNKIRVFISYARKDGEDFARQLRADLMSSDPRLHVWIDRWGLRGGENWWTKIQQELESAEFLIIVATPAAMLSKWTEKEWSYARRKGICVCPIKGNADLDTEKIPNWMARKHFYSLDKDWKALCNYITTPCRPISVPAMAPPISPGTVNRPEKINEIISLFSTDLSQESDESPTVVLIGPAGFGKTTLATLVCNDDRIKKQFDDGILWITLGREPSVLELTSDLCARLSGNMLKFGSIEAASDELNRLLENLNCLLVIDDAWGVTEVRHFLRTSTCSVLLTTRKAVVADLCNKAVEVYQMTKPGARELLSKDLPSAELTTELDSFADQLGRWPLLLDLANAQLRWRQNKGQLLPAALSDLSDRFSNLGLEAFDRRDLTERHTAVRRAIAVSLDDLVETALRKRLVSLAIFPEAIDIPLEVVAELWAMSIGRAEADLELYDQLSLLHYQPSFRSFRIHDVFRQHYMDLLRETDDPKKIHNRLLKAWGSFHSLPHFYAWNWLSYHLIQANRPDDLKKLLSNLSWLDAKVKNTDGWSLVSDFNRIPVLGKRLSTLKLAVSLSCYAVSVDPSQFIAQLLGRLNTKQFQEIFSSVSIEDMEPAARLRPITVSLRSPVEGLKLVIHGHLQAVNALCFTPDGKFIVSGSNDGTVRMWHVTNGKESRRFEGHEGPVAAVCALSNGEYIVSGSLDKNIHLWHLQDGLVKTFCGHEDCVNTLAVLPDNMILVSGSGNSRLPLDNSIRIWSLESGTEIRQFKNETRGLPSPVNDVCITKDGRYVVAGYGGDSITCDKSVRIIDIQTGSQIKSIRRKDPGGVYSVGLQSDEEVVFGCGDGTVRVWNWQNGELRIFKGHEYQVDAVAVFPDGGHAVSGSADQTIRLWDLNNREEIGCYKEHAGPVNALAIYEEKIASASEDGTIHLWTLPAASERARQPRHFGAVNDLALTPDGNRLISVSIDGTVRIWDTKTGNQMQILRGHKNSIKKVEVSCDGKMVLTGPVIYEVDWLQDIGMRPIKEFAPDPIKLWSLDNYQLLGELKGQRGIVSAIVLNKDQRRAATMSILRHRSGRFLGSVICLWDLPNKEMISKRTIKTVAVLITNPALADCISKEKHPVAEIESGSNIWFAPCNRTSYMGLHRDVILCDRINEDGFELYDVHQARLLGLMPAGKFVDASVSRKTNRVAFSNKFGEISVFDLNSNKELCKIHVKNERSAIAISLDGNFVAARDNRTIGVWEAATGTPISSFTGDSAIANVYGIEGSAVFVVVETSGRLHFLTL